MPSLDDHFAALTKIRAPDEWPDLDALEPRPVRLPHVRQLRRLGTRPEQHQRGRHLAAAALALVVAMAGIGFAIWAFQRASQPPSHAQPRPCRTAGSRSFGRSARLLSSIQTAPILLS